MNTKIQILLKHILDLNKIIVLISFMLLTGCAGVQTFVDTFNRPVPNDDPPAFIGPTITIYFDGNVSVPALDGTYKWIKEKKKSWRLNNDNLITDS